jgi:non-specific protein-tyrosine kinase
MSPSELFNSSKMKAILSCVSAKFDYVILDSPPILPVTDATILSTMADSVIVLVDVGQTRRKALRKAVGRLREVHANLAGVILNRIPVTSEDYYHYGSYYREPTSDHRRRPGGLGEDSVAPNGKANSLLGKLRRKQSI